MRGGVERDTLGRAARRVGAQVGPVAAVLDAQHVVQPRPAPGSGGAECVGERGDQLARAVADDDDAGQLLAGQDADGVRGDVGRRSASGGSGRS